MSDPFVPLAAFLRPPPEAPAPLPEVAGEGLSAAERGERAAEEPDEYAVTLAAVRRFRAGIADATALAVQRLLREIAENVLARELTIGPADLAAIVAKSRERARFERVLAVRVHPCDRHALGKLELERVYDDRLSAGDAVLELRNGTIDLRLRTRLTRVLAACTP